MDRLEAIKNYLKPYKTQQMRKKIEGLKTCSDNQLLVSVNMLLQTALETQKQQDWEPVCLCLFHFLSSIVTGSHKYQVFLADEQIYLDTNQIACDYRADFLYQEDFGMLKKELQDKFTCISDYELSYSEHWLQYENRKLMEVFWKKQTEEIIKLETFKQLRKKTPFRFLFGDYMGTLKLVALCEEEQYG